MGNTKSLTLRDNKIGFIYVPKQFLFSKKVLIALKFNIVFKINSINGKSREKYTNTSLKNTNIDIYLLYG